MTFDDTQFEAPGRGADQCIPLFRWEARQNQRRTTEEGRPIFDQVPFVQILIPGDKNATVDRKVTEADKTRWPRQWEKFQQNSESPPEGTPLDQWPALSVSQIAELRALNILTIEALANLSDIGLQRIGPGARNFQRRAKAFLRTAKDDGYVYEMMQKIDDLTARLEVLEGENAELRAAAPPPKRRGRPPKVRDDELAEPL